MKAIALFFLVVIFISSCEKKKEEEPKPTITVKGKYYLGNTFDVNKLDSLRKITKIRFEGEKTYEFVPSDLYYYAVNVEDGVYTIIAEIEGLGRFVSTNHEYTTGGVLTVNGPNINFRYYPKVLINDLSVNTSLTDSNRIHFNFTIVNYNKLESASTGLFPEFSMVVGDNENITPENADIFENFYFSNNSAIKNSFMAISNLNPFLESNHVRINLSTSFSRTFKGKKKYVRFFSTYYSIPDYFYNYYFDYKKQCYILMSYNKQGSNAVQVQF